MNWVFTNGPVDWGSIRVNCNKNKASICFVFKFYTPITRNGWKLILISFEQMKSRHFIYQEWQIFFYIQIICVKTEEFR